jgi:two-component sensor histidine kinase
MHRAGEREVEVVVADDGVGPPEAFVAPDGTGLRDGPTLGLRLIASLTEQIEGRIGCSRSESGGTRFVLRFVPDAPESRRMAA